MESDRNQARKRKRSVEESETASSSKLKTTTASDVKINHDKELVEETRPTGSGSSFDLVSISASCCSTTINQAESEEVSEVETYSMCCNSSKELERRERTRVEGELDSATSEPPSTEMAEYSPRGAIRITEKTERPTEVELEDFFAKAERKLRDKFLKKYNYDIAKDEPLEGRYEWIRLKP